jgi:hypothetical protein
VGAVPNIVDGIVRHPRRGKVSDAILPAASLTTTIP